MHGYRNPYHQQDQRFIGFGFPFLGALAGGFAGGLLGGAFSNPRPYYGYPPFGYPPVGYPPVGYPGCCRPGRYPFYY